MCARLASGTSQIAAYIEEGIESARPAGWPVMGLQTSESGGYAPSSKVRLFIRFLFAMIPATRLLSLYRLAYRWLLAEVLRMADDRPGHQAKKNKCGTDRPNQRRAIPLEVSSVAHEALSRAVIPPDERNVGLFWSSLKFQQSKMQGTCA
jgi:hypothetical protein